jgi:cellulose synthase/poly-beta-1,6-N-acetylglucosamine synthase-like glycosyltransferase
MVGYFENKKIMAITPSLKVYKPENFLQKIQYIEYLIGIFLRKIFAFLGSIHVTPGPLTIYKKSFFKKYGAYDPYNLTEDIEIALRIQKHNFIIENSVDASVYTVAPATFNKLLKQRLRWYMGFIKNTINYKCLFSPKYGNLGMFILPASFFSVLLVIVTLFYASYKFITRTIIQNLINLNSINFDFWRLIKINLDTFYIDFSFIAFLVTLSIIAGILIILTAKKISKETIKIKFLYPFYLIFYWILFGFWWIMAGIYTACRKTVVWGQRR